MYYRDQTYCPFWKKCTDSLDCWRALTEEVQDSADKWWGKGFREAPICVFAELPDCFRAKVDKGELLTGGF